MLLLPFVLSTWGVTEGMLCSSCTSSHWYKNTGVQSHIPEESLKCCLFEASFRQLPGFHSLIGSVSSAGQSWLMLWLGISLGGTQSLRVKGLAPTVVLLGLERTLGGGTWEEVLRSLRVWPQEVVLCRGLLWRTTELGPVGSNLMCIFWLTTQCDLCIHTIATVHHLPSALARAEVCTVPFGPRVSRTVH